MLLTTAIATIFFLLTVNAFSTKYAYQFGESVLLTAGLVTLGGYVALLFDLLQPFSVALYFYFFYQIISIKSFGRTTQENKPLVITIVVTSFVLYFIYENYVTTITFWDDFTHWGYYARELYTTNKISNSYGGSFTDYPPGAAILIYFFLLPAKLLQLNERTEVAAMYSLWFTYALFCLVLVRSENYSRLIFCLLIGYLLSFVGTHGIFGLMPDAFIGVLAAPLIILALKRVTVQNYIILVTTAAMIALIKPAAVLMPLVILTSISIYYTARGLLDGRGLHVGATARNAYFSSSLSLFLAAMIIFFVRISWNIYADDIKFGGWTLKFSVDDLLSLYTSSTELQVKVTGAFLNKFLIGNTIDLPITYGIPGLILYFWVGLFLLLSFLMPERRVEIVRVAVVLVPTSISWIVFLYWIYIFGFSSNDALALSSFNRYLLPVTSLILILILYFTQDIYQRWLRITLGLLAAFPILVASNGYVRTYNILFGNEQNLVHRVQARDKTLADRLKAFLPGTRVLILSECTDDFGKLIFSYQAYPLAVSRTPTYSPDCRSNSVGYPDDNLDLFKKNGRFSSYEYLVVLTKSPWFSHTHGHRFSGGFNRGIYMIQVKGDHLQMVPVP